MKASAAFPSKYLRAADLQDQEHTVTMKAVEIERIGDDDPKPVLYFTKGSKGMVLNKTNSKVIAKAYGDEMDEWEGKSIVLFPAMVEFKGDMVEAIRCRAPKAKGGAVRAAPGHTELNPPPQDDDEILF